MNRSSGINAEIVADGAKSKGFTFDEGVQLAQQYRLRPVKTPARRTIKGPYAYGCNGILAFRTDRLGSLRFDERLSFYGWQEDLDFCGGLLRVGTIVKSDLVWGVHLGAKHGKGSELQLGYSQIINPIYVASKGHVSYGYALQLALRNALTNLIKSAWPESYVDRRGRLRGNMIGLSRLLMGQVLPEYVRKLAVSEKMTESSTGATSLSDVAQRSSIGKMPKQLKLGLVIASHGRPNLLQSVLTRVLSQQRAPDQIVLSTVNEQDTLGIDDSGRSIQKVFGAPGLTRQRNRGISRLIGSVDVIIFIDDDFVVGEDYFAKIESIFASDKSIIGVSGAVIADGAKSPGFTFEEGLRLVEQYRPQEQAPVMHQISGTYGCNMAFRSAAIGSARFDERLPLYGWQEDLDFCGSLRNPGRIVWTNLVWGVHLGTKQGKGSEVKLGYSQIINPIYISKKGNMTFRYACRLIVRNCLANAYGSIRPEHYIDRRGRLRGNLIGLYHLMTGRVTPEYILKLN